MDLEGLNIALSFFLGGDILKIINKGKFLKTIGWTTVGVGLYLVGLGVAYDGEAETIKPKKQDDNVINADFTVVSE